MSKRVYVGLSGGVDSALAAALLREQGYTVTGVFIKIWQPEFTECTWKEDRLDAMRVAAALGIPFREIDLSDEYKRDVVDTMVAGYARGITPNPDVLCNRYIKFGVFAQWCFAEGAEYVATGHYAQTRASGTHTDLVRAADASKDQSYFLCRLNQHDLRRALFPIGGILKSRVRSEAIKRGIPVAKKPDSQGLCFVGHITMHEFLSRYITLTPGPVVEGGKTVGEHYGAALYTLGQRHGFTHTHDVAPRFVTGIDVEKNTIQVSPRREDAARAFAYLDEVQWINEPPILPTKLLVQARYHETPILADIRHEGMPVRVDFDTLHMASPGQLLVMYNNDTCVGSGILAA